MSIAIEFNNISKQYRLGLVSTGTLCHDLNRFWQTKILHREDPYLKIGETNDRTTKGSSEYVWALRDINFKVEQGDVVGIIGRNGAGKSTLLKLLSRVTSPTTGFIRARGRIASLLEVGTGFHPEMTGRENIYMNGSIMGMTRAEITRKLDEIVDFSGCERYLDTPVKRYSSGMSVRLGFAIAAHLDPEILVVDEVLAVGDAEFQKKAIGKMQDVAHGGGRTVLFVSHNMAAVKSLCKSAILLEYGQVKEQGKCSDIVSSYLCAAKNIQSVYNCDDVQNGKVAYICYAKIDYENEMLKCQVCYNVRKKTRFVVAIMLSDFLMTPIMTTVDSDYGESIEKSEGFYTRYVHIPIENWKTGRYFLTISLSDMVSTRYDYLENILTFEIRKQPPYIQNTFEGRRGVLLPKVEWSDAR